MIGYLSGEIISASPTKLLINVNGVGYTVSVSLNTFESIGGKTKVSLYIVTMVREDAINLFGFADEQEKAMFELLISVSGIGAKSALSILSGIRPADLKNTIASGDSARLAMTPGIGKKTADRLILELREKIDAIGPVQTGMPRGIRSEAISALLALGYNQKNAETVVREILSESGDISIEDLLKAALKKFSGR